MKISELVDGVRKQDIVLPEFQREYVWSKEQAKQLMVSLTKKYPVGGILIWKTDNPPELKNVTTLPESFGTVQVLLDGQQRLTTLYMFIIDEIPPFYSSKDITNDPRNLYFNINLGEFQYYMPTLMKENLLWLPVTECFKQDIDIFKIAEQTVSEGESPFDLASRYNKNLNKLKHLDEVDLPVQYVPSYAFLTDAIDIFDRVNRQGTKLSDAELALTHITGKWSIARRLMKEKIDELSKRQFSFNLTFMTRALNGIVTNRALFEIIHDKPREELEKGWNTLSKTLDYLVNILPGQAFIHSTDDLSTTNALIPLIVYLSLNDGKFPNEKTMKRGLHWLYSALIWSRYTSQVDQRLDHDISLVVRNISPWNDLCDQIIDQRGRIEVKSNDLQGRAAQHPLYKMVMIISKAHGAKDWFNGIMLGTIHGKSYYPHSHHIFPQSILYKELYDSENHLHRKIVNEIANRAFLTAESNLSLSDKLPENYLPIVENKYQGALVKQFVPIEPSLWKVERYPDFLEARRQLIARKINEFMSALIVEPEIVHERSVEELITLGESATLEFKTTLQWDIIQNCINKNLRHSVLKTIVAFLNTNGGTLVIGVEDDGNVLGLDNDFNVSNGSIDKFEQLLTSLIYEKIGPAYSPFLKIRHEIVNDKKVCVVDIDRSSEPAYLEGSNGKEFHIRMGNTTRVLDAEETVNYIQMNWE